jgi:hypothetical protein
VKPIEGRKLNARNNLPGETSGQLSFLGSTELRRFLKGESADPSKVERLSRHDGELDGELSNLYAKSFAKLGQSLSAQQIYLTPCALR